MHLTPHCNIITALAGQVLSNLKLRFCEHKRKVVKAFLNRTSCAATVYHKMIIYNERNVKFNKMKDCVCVEVYDLYKGCIQTLFYFI